MTIFTRLHRYLLNQQSCFGGRSGGGSAGCAHCTMALLAILAMRESVITSGDHLESCIGVDVTAVTPVAGTVRLD
jgi:hypothetical protein